MKICIKCNIEKEIILFELERNICKDCRYNIRKIKRSQANYSPDLTIKEKNCPKCSTIQPISEFHKNKMNKDGYVNRCKNCRNKDTLKFYNQHSEKIKEASFLYRLNNKEKILKYKRKYRYNREQTDILYKLKRRLRNRLYYALKKTSWKKDTHFSEYIGCSLEDLKNSLEIQFEDGMTWDNYGEWEIDHIIPLSSAKTPEELYKLCHHTNLQPLWAEDNRKKSNKVS